jgi:hypothetical protein
MPSSRCELCGRKCARLDKHHLIPRTRHSNKRNKKQFDRREVHDRLAMLCKPCHKTVHATLTEKELEREYNTLEALRSHEQISRFVKWVRKQPTGATVTVRQSQAKKRRTAARDRRRR